MRAALPAILIAALAACSQSQGIVVPESAHRMMREQGPGIDPGKDAADLKLVRLEGGTVQLSDHKGKRPVMLIFGSYT